jgi:membrane associated rhomboid family serine protease
MIPLRDTVRARTVPYVNYAIIVLCSLVFLYEITLGKGMEQFAGVYGVVPARLTAGYAGGALSAGLLLPLLTSLFLHGGWLHLIGNMIYLYVFGDNIEDRLGHVGYLFFYLLAGVGASLAQVLSGPQSAMPMIGASGAIAGVLGAYFLLYPRARILTLIPLFLYFPVVELPAFFFLGIWFAMQFVQGALAGSEGEGIAWWAHAGGFIVGGVLLPIFLLLRKLLPIQSR